MSRQRLYIVHGMGSDAVGLVGAITSAIANAGGNIIDLRQDVLHGLFTIFFVVDLAESKLHIDEFGALIKNIGEETGLSLSVDKYVRSLSVADRMLLSRELVGRLPWAPPVTRKP